jgi:hypothetical protein
MACRYGLYKINEDYSNASNWKIPFLSKKTKASTSHIISTPSDIKKYIIGFTFKGTFQWYNFYNIYLIAC